MRAGAARDYARSATPPLGWYAPWRTAMSDQRSSRRFVVRKASRQEWLDGLPLREYFVDRGETESARRALRAALATGAEREMQTVFEEHPRLLVDRLACHLGWVMPQRRLGSEFVPDFLVAEQLSPGFYWQAVELESPRVPMFTKRGDPSRYLTHAIRQVQDWRSWLASNQAYAARPRGENGLGLIQISPNLPGLIIIGRRAATDGATNLLRRQMMTDLRIEIRTYDAFLDDMRSGPLYAQFGDPSWW